MSNEHLETGRLALETLRLHLVGLVDHIDDEKSRDLLLALSEVETAGNSLERLGALAKVAESSPDSHAHPRVAISLGSAAGQIEDLSEHLTSAAGWVGADSASEAEPHLLAAFVTLNRLREALGLRLKMVANTPGYADPGACEVRGEPASEVAHG